MEDALIFKYDLAREDAANNFLFMYYVVIYRIQNKSGLLGKWRNVCENAWSEDAFPA